jgi:Fur family ferric uptake transcriptional regulator
VSTDSDKIISFAGEKMMNNSDLRKAGLKVTIPRTRILEMLENSPEKHLSAEDIYKALMEAGDDVGLATVYRVLAQFEAAGLVNRLHFEGGQSVFELNQGEHHDHIICTQCHKVEEFTDDEIEVRQKAIAKRMGYVITDHALNIFGVCGECQLKS